MTQAKKLKQTIRARARKTGESYTAARRRVLAARSSAPPAPANASALPAAALASAASRRGGLSEAAALKATSHGFDHWFAVLDASGHHGHTALARHLASDHAVPGWHAQGIAVAYERARGLRAVNQASSGDFQVAVSRVVAGTVAGVAEAFHDAQRRSQWLRDADARLVRALDAALRGPQPKRVRLRDSHLGRLRYPWDRSRIEISITATAGGRVSVAATNTKLPDTAMVEERRAQWKVALDGLRRYLASS